METEKNTNINNQELIYKMIEFYDKWANSHFRLDNDIYPKIILGSGVSIWLKSVILYKTEYSKTDETTFKSLLDIYLIHQ